jgi:hypothetical protein
MSLSIFNSKTPHGALFRFLVLATLIVSPALIVLFERVPGAHEPFYVRFTTPRRPSLVLGTSRGAQGIVPSIITDKLGDRFAGPLLNFSFTASNSPWGPAYFRAIQKKIASSQKPALFILEVSPIAFLIDKMEYRVFGAQYSSTDREDLLPEANKGLLNCMKLFNVSPNLNYVFCRESQIYKLVSHKLKGASSEYNLHTDGWLEVKLTQAQLSSPEKRKERAESFATLMAKSQWSRTREEWFLKTIDYLSKRGHIFIVRLPTDPALRSIEDRYFPDFENRMSEISRRMGAKYFSYSAEKFRVQTTDGSHLFRESSMALSADLAEKIQASSND